MHERVVVRRRLLDVLDGGQQVSVVSAPVGFGKTTLVEQWHDLRAGQGGETTLLRLRGPDPSVLSDRLQDLRDRPVALIVDGYDLVRSAATDAELAEFLHASPGSRLVLSVRCRPQRGGVPWPTEGLAPDLSTVHVGPSELRLTVDEAQELFAASGLGPGTGAARIAALVGGWPALVRRAALGLADSADHVDPDVVVARVVREYLAREVLPTFEDLGDLTWLGLLAVPARLTAGSAALVLDEDEAAAAMELESLARLGFLMTERYDGDTAYAWPGGLHRPMRELLGRGVPDELVALDTRLARWHLDRAEPALAVVHAELARDPALVLEVLDVYWLPLLVYDNGVLEALFARAPHEWFEGSAFVDGVRALTLRLPRDPTVDAVELPMDWADIEAAVRSPTVRTSLNRGLVAVFALRRTRRLPEALELVLALQRLALAARVHNPQAVGDLLAPIFLLSGLVQELAGDLEAAAQPLQWGYETAHQSVLRGSRRHTAAHLAMVTAFVGDPAGSEAWSRRADESPPTAGWVSPRATIAQGVAGVLVATARLDRDRAHETLVELLSDTDPLDELWPFVLYARSQYALLWGDRHAAIQQILSERAARPHWAAEGSALGSLLLAAEVDLLIALGHRHEAQATLARAGAARQPLLDPPRARLALLSGQPELAVSLARSGIVSAPTLPRVREELTLVEVAALHRLGRLDEARELLARFCADLSAEAPVRAFAMAPRGDLVSVAQGVDAAAPIVARLERLALAPVFPDTLDPVRLTRREQVVLAELALGRTRDQIARALSVSSNTVKSQTHSIYRKLGVSSRDQALAAARSQGLLSS